MDKVILEGQKKCDITFVCPGLRKEDIDLSFDPKSGQLSVEGKPRKEDTRDIPEDWDLEISFSHEVSPKYRSRTISLVVADGLGKIMIGAAKRIITIPK